jgi:SAM-dependent methyltransferase
MDIRAYNRAAWDRQVERGNRWTVPVGDEAIAAARRGEWDIFLTPSKPVPRAWFPGLQETDVLCLASGGGQQGPILAAVGAKVTVLDNAPRQLEQDRCVAERHALPLVTVEGDMADLSVFPDQRFALVVHPVSNVFVPDVRPVWQEAFRVLRHGGVLLAGFSNPVTYLFDYELADRTGVLQVEYALPYSDLTSLTAEERQRYVETGVPLEFSHTLEDQIGGQLDAGFLLTGFFEDAYDEEENDPLTNYMPTFIATRAVKPSRSRSTLLGKPLLLVSDCSLSSLMV